MIDHGYVFGGGEWVFQDSPLRGHYFRPDVYRGIECLEDFDPWLDQVRNFPETVLLRIMRSVPSAWLEGDEENLLNLIDQLIRRRAQVERLILEMKSIFPNWERNYPVH